MMQQVITDLQRLRRRSRFMLILQRVSVLLAWMIAGLLGVILFDYALRLPGTFRLVLLLAGAGAVLYAVWMYVRSAIIFSPSLTQLALRVERVLPNVAGRLASSVEFATAGVDQGNQMAARSVRETQTRLAGENVKTVISPGRTWRDIAMMLAIAAFVSVLAASNPTAASTGLKRFLMPYSDAKWPARTGVKSLMDQVVSAGVHPRGQALAVRAMVTRGALDQRVDAHYRLRADGAWQPWQRIVLTHQGGGVHERLVDTNADEIELYFTTDDDETSSQNIELVPPPAVRRASLTVTPPPYAAGRIPTFTTELGQGLDDRAVTDTASLAGSTAVLRFELNKPLPTSRGGSNDAWIKDTFGWDDSALPSFAADTDNPTVWTIQWRLTGTKALHLHLLDEHGLSNFDQIAYRIEAVEDRPPAVTITKPQADEAVLPTAVVGLAAEARDDVGLAGVGLQAHVQLGNKAPANQPRPAGAGNVDEALAQTPAWENHQPADEMAAGIKADLDLGALHVSEGDVVLVSGVAKDVYENAAPESDAPPQAPTSHEVRSPIRRLRVISETDFATQLRRQLGAVRQNAIRIEALQAELQDDVIDDGMQPGIDRAQAQIGERIAGQRASVEEIERMLRQNRLDDAQLGQTLSQAHDLLDFAGRSANKAVEEIEKRQTGQSSKRPNDQAENSKNPLAPGSAGGSEKSESKGSKTDSRPQTPGSPGAKPQDESKPAPGHPGDKSQQSGAKGEQSQKGSQQSGSQSGKPQGEQSESQGQKPQSGAQQKSDSKSGSGNPKSKSDEPKAAEPAEADKPVTEAQQEVRDELTDLIKLLDRDEDTWVVKRQLEDLMKKQSQLETSTGRMGEQTMGQKPEVLPEQQRSELERMAQKQRDELANDARKMIQQMRDRAKALQKVDPQSAQAMRTAADTAEQRQLPKDMEDAGKHIEQNQMTSAQSKQQSAQSTMQQMHNDLAENKRAQAQQLIRQLASLVESIQRLISVQENELTALATGKDTGEFNGLDRSMIRLNQNTQSVASEARTAEQDARRIARSLDRAADTQGAAVIALRAAPVNAADAETAENRSLELLKEAKAAAEELQKKKQEEEVQKKREELMSAYRKFAERQVAVRGETLPLTEVQQLDRRQLVESRRLGSQQDEIRTGLNGLRDTTAEILDSPVFVYVHRMIDTWSAAASDSLLNGNANVDVTDRQQQIADSLGQLIKALEEMMAPPDEFAKDQPDQQGGGEGGQQPLIPPVAQLRLLQGLQEQVYNITKEIDGRSDLDPAQRRTRLRDIGQQQRELMDLGKQMLDALEGGQAHQPKVEVPKDAPPVTPEPEPVTPQP